MAVQGNVTFDPLAFAEPVNDPEIAEIIDLESGDFLDVVSFISGRRYDRLISERVLISESLASKPKYGCAVFNAGLSSRLARKALFLPA